MLAVGYGVLCVLCLLSGRVVYCVVGRCTVCVALGRGVLCGRAVYCVLGWCTVW